MGYLRHKYTKSYYLGQDNSGKKTSYGVAGIEAFQNGDIRKIDKDILRRVNFSGKFVLDIGFGRGEALKFASDHGAKKLVGVDFSEKATQIASEYLNRYGIFPELRCQDALAFIENYDRDSDLFDIVLMLDFIEHVPRAELTNIFLNLHQIISKQAIVAINTPIFHVDNDVIADGIDLRAIDYSDTFEETAGMHCNRYTRESLVAYMLSLGYQPIAGHFFIRGLSEINNKRMLKLSWATAFFRGFPIRINAVAQSEIFAYADPDQNSIMQRKYHAYLPRKIFRFTLQIVRKLTLRFGHTH